MHKLLVKMKFGSHVYGTNLPTSDEDYKAIYLPSAEDILLQRVKQTDKDSTKEDPRAKNTADDVDIETFSVQRYFDLLLEGQTVALDMLFVPEEFIVYKTPTWDFIRANRDKFIHSGVSAFAGYCRTQANKYGIKGSRMAAVKNCINLIETYKKHERLELYQEMLKLVASTTEHVDIVMCQGPNKETLTPHLEVCNRKYPFHSKVDYVLKNLKKIYDGYGHRARAAEQNEGIDWKALMHAVRVQEEAKELLSTGKITFPRPERELLLKIRKGEMPYKEVASIIETGLEELEKIQETSILNSEPNRDFARLIVMNLHHSTVQSSSVAQLKGLL